MGLMTEDGRGLQESTSASNQLLVHPIRSTRAQEAHTRVLGSGLDRVMRLHYSR